jgi:hypothetical protein
MSNTARVSVLRPLRVITTTALIMLVAAGCAGPGPTTPPRAEAVDSAAPTPTLTPTPEGLQDVDLADGRWLYSPGGYSAPVSLEFQAGTATDDGVTYTMKDPVYADANGDGVDDAVVPIERADGNGWESLWYVFVADGPSAVQVPAPIARAARCSDAVTGVRAADGGGFVVEQTLRQSPWDDAIPCAEPGTGVQTRVITIRAGANGVLWPVQQEPILAWGGLCPGSEWMDAPPEKITLYTAPDPDSASATVANEEIGVFPLRSQLWEVLPRESGVTADDWAFVGFVTSQLPASEAVRLHCAWAPRG